jgi:hypothetical protein
VVAARGEVGCRLREGYFRRPVALIGGVVLLLKGLLCPLRRHVECICGRRSRSSLASSLVLGSITIAARTPRALLSCGWDDRHEDADRFAIEVDDHRFARGAHAQADLCGGKGAPKEVNVGLAHMNAAG